MLILSAVIQQVGSGEGGSSAPARKAGSLKKRFVQLGALDGVIITLRTMNNR